MKSARSFATPSGCQRGKGAGANGLEHAPGLFRSHAVVQQARFDLTEDLQPFAQTRTQAVGAQPLPLKIGGDMTVIFLQGLPHALAQALLLFDGADLAHAAVRVMPYGAVSINC